MKLAKCDEEIQFIKNYKKTGVDAILALNQTIDILENKLKDNPILNNIQKKVEECPKKDEFDLLDINFVFFNKKFNNNFFLI